MTRKEMIDIIIFLNREMVSATKKRDTEKIEFLRKVIDQCITEALTKND